MPPTQDTPTRVPFGRSVDNFAYDLVSGNDMRQPRRQLAFHNMQIGAAHSARPDFQHDMAWGKRRRWSISDLQRTLRDGSGST